MAKVFGHTLKIEWTKFTHDTSIFVPCVNRKEIQSYINKECKRLGMRVLSKRVIEKGMYGVRAWRL